jgi:hypothetical protein
VKKTAFWGMGDALTMEAVCTSETSVYFYKTTQHYITEGWHLHTRCHENLKSHWSIVFDKAGQGS